MSAKCLDKLKGHFSTTEIRALRRRVDKDVLSGLDEAAARRTALEEALEAARAERREIDRLVAAAMPKQAEVALDTPAEFAFDPPKGWKITHATDSGSLPVSSASAAEWKRSPGSISAAWSAAVFYAHRDGKPYAMVEGNSYMNKVYHVYPLAEDPVSKTTVRAPTDVGVATPDGTLWVVTLVPQDTKPQAATAPAEPTGAIGVAGKIVTVRTAKGREVRVRYRLVPRSMVVVSHDASGSPNPAYPAHLQPRARDRAALLTQVNELAHKLVAEGLAESWKASDGAPIAYLDEVPEAGKNQGTGKTVWRYVIESGNGRTGAVMLAYDLGIADDYRDFVLAGADRFGMDAAAVESFDDPEPILIRERMDQMTDAERAEFTREANQSDLAAMSPTERAFSDAERISDDLLAIYLPDANGDPLAASNRPFVSSFLQALGGLEGGGFVTATGGPTQQLAERIKLAVFAKAYGRADLVSLLSEEPDTNVRGVLLALSTASAAFAKARAIDPTWDGGRLDVLAPLIEAFELIKRQRDTGQALDEIVAQLDIFTTVSDGAMQLARFIDANKRSPVRLGDAFRVMGELTADRLRALKNDDMFGGESATLHDIIRAVNSFLEDKYDGKVSITQGDLFAPQEGKAEPGVGPGADSDNDQGGQPEGHGGASAGLSGPETGATLEEGAVGSEETGNAGHQRDNDRQASGQTGSGGKRQGDRGTMRKGRPDTGPDDRAVEAGAAEDGSAPGAAEDTAGVRSRDNGETQRGDDEVSGSGDGLAGQQGTGKSGVASGGTGRRGGSGGGGGGGRGATRGPRKATAAGIGAPGSAEDQAVAAENQDEEVEAPPTQAETLEARAEHFHVDDPERVYGGTPKARFRKNRLAIETYRVIKGERREATQEEREILAGYTGWGSFGQEVFQGTWARPIYKEGWVEENDWLRSNLGEAEWRSAQDSIRNAHYTDPPTVQAMWAMVERMGFTGGRVLEPSAGIGNFIALMPKALKERSSLTAVELDELTAGMLSTIYPGANVRHKGFQDVQTPDGFYDLVIGNWPFDSVGPADRRYNKLSPSLHDYFFLKALDQVRPGGLVVGITSRYSMDGKTKAVRAEMAKKGELIAAFRLPSGAFKEYAGTAVVTDIVIFRRRAEDLADSRGESWVEAPEVTFGGNNEKAAINQYFQSNPEHVLGKLGWGHGTTYRGAGVIVTPPDNLGEILTRLPDELPGDAYLPPSRAKHIRFISNNSEERLHTVILGEDGELYQVLGEQLAVLNDVQSYRVKDRRETAKREAQLRALVGIRRAYGKLIDAELAGAEGAEDLRADLRKQYQDFAKAHGTLHGSRGLEILKSVGDPFYPAIASLEIKRNGAYEPSAIMSRPTMRSRKKIENPSIRDAYVMERNLGLDVRISAIAATAKVSEAEVERDLISSGAAYRQPGGVVVPADVYLSGNVRRKLREAQAAAEAGEDMERNIKALEEVIPATVPYFNIEPRLGAQWVSAEYYRQFVAEEILSNQEAADQIELEWRNNRWVVNPSAAYSNTAPAVRWRSVTGYRKLPDGRMQEAGSKVIALRQLLEAAFNNGTMRFTEKLPDGTRIHLVEVSAAANERATAIREAFEDWIWRSPERKIALERDYNEVMNAIAFPKFDGSFLTFEGMALQLGEKDFNLRSHQINAIWRALVQGSGLYAHEVGTGKTYTIAGIAVESRRFGLTRKPLILAHNANSASVAADIQSMYPGAKVLYVNNIDRSRIKETLHQIRNEDWDAVVMPHSLVDRLTLSRETLEAMAAEEIMALEAAFEDEMEETSGGVPKGFDLDDTVAVSKLRNITAKELAKQRLAIKERIEKMAQAASREDAIMIEDLGVDMLLVDEAHVFKKPPFTTRMKMKGLNKQSNPTSIALKLLCDYIKSQNNGRGVHLFTGTPITNTLTEIFHAQRYVMQDAMKRDGISDWDSWFNTFATGVSDIEFTSAGQYEAVTKLAGFINVAELRRMMSTHMDVVFADKMEEFAPRKTKSGKTLADSPNDAELDELRNGRTLDPVGRPYKKIVIDSDEMSPEQQSILTYLQGLAQEWKEADGRTRMEWQREGDEHHPLLIDGVASRASIDARMEDPSLPDYPKSKVNRALKNILHHYRSEPDAAQVVFMDKGYSDDRTVRGVKVPGHNLVKELVAKLQAAGIPASEIAVVGGGIKPEKKAAIADAVNTGKIRVVIGQTETLGTGVNMQARLRAMHHLDAPWMPGQLEQRNGRGWRQGNTWNTVLEYRYVTERIDGKRWQVLSVKERFIKSFLTADENTRVIEGDAVSDDADDSLASTLAEAIGDPRVLIRQKLTQDVEKLMRKERVHVQAMVEARAALQKFKKEEPRLKARIEAYRNDYLTFTKAYRDAEKKQSEGYRGSLRDFVKGLGLGLSAEQLDAIQEHGWGPRQPDRDLAKLVTHAVAQAKERGVTRPDEPTTVAIDAVIEGKAVRSYSGMRQKLDELNATADSFAKQWKDIGTLFGFTLQARQAWNWGDANARVSLQLVSPSDDSISYQPSSNTAESLVSELRSILTYAYFDEAKLDKDRRDQPNLERIADSPFARQKDLDRKRKRLEEIEADMERNPVPAPAWLRNGAPVDTEVLVDGKPYIVEGHQWSDEGYFVLLADDSGAKRVSYTEVTGADGGALYDPVEFKAPPKVGRPEPGVYLVTSPGGVAEPEPRFLNTAQIDTLLATGHRIDPAELPNARPAGLPVAAEGAGSDGAPGEVMEGGYTYGYGDSSDVPSRKHRVSADPAAGPAYLFPAPAVSAQRDQAGATFKALYRQVPVGEIRTSPGRIDSPSAAAHVLAPIRKYGQETFVSLVLDADDKPIAVIRHSKGERSSAPAHPGEIASAIAATPGAAAVWFGHNHPTGVPNPSGADLSSTSAIHKALDGSGIEVRGHVVLGQGAAAYHINPTGYSSSPISVTPGVRSGSVTITESMARRRPQGELTQIQHPSELAAFADTLGRKDAMVLMDNQHRVIGVLAIAPSEMRALRADGRVRRLLEAFNAANASAVAILSTDKEAAANLSRFLRQGQHARLLDVLLHRQTGWASMMEIADPMLTDAGPFFAKTGEQSTPAMGEAEAKETATRVFSESGLAASGVKLRLPDTEADLPKAVREAIKAEGADGLVDGFLFGAEVWVLPWRMRSVEDIERTVLHEGHGHWGFRRLYGPDVAQRAQDIYQAIGGDAGVRAFAGRHDIDLEAYFDAADSRYANDPRGRTFLLIDELLAHAQAKGPKSLPQRVMRALQEFMGAVRQWLRNHGFARLTEWSDADLFHELRMMREAAILPPDTTADGKPVRFAREVEDVAPEYLEAVGSDGQTDTRLVPEAQAKELDAGETITLYRAMVMSDGKLYPPMSARMSAANGRLGLRRPEPIGKWMRSEERLDLVPTEGPNKGKFPLKKADGGTTWALYAPYFHASPSPLNDQFTAAWQNDGKRRLQLVTVEVEVPASEKAAAYKAEGSQKKTGPNTWRAGVVASKIPGGRSVFLSRFAKIRRIVPEAEVAQKIADIVNPHRLRIPVNTVTPQLREELERAGVQIAPRGTKGEAIRFTLGDRPEDGASDARADAIIKQYAGTAGAPTPAELRRAARQYREVEEQNTEALRAHDEAGKPLLAPNGKPSKLNREQWILTRTPSFQRWFGDSKVVDANGEPLVMYHGTNADFSVFDRSFASNKIAAGAGFFFSGDASLAGRYSAGKKSGANLMPVFLAIRSPRTVNIDGLNALQGGRVREAMQAAGEDGLQVTVTGGPSVWMALDSAQIKSATGNAGTYSANPDIRFARGAPAAPAGSGGPAGPVGTGHAGPAGPVGTGHAGPAGPASAAPGAAAGPARAAPGASWTPGNAVGATPIYTVQGMAQASQTAQAAAGAAVQAAMQAGPVPRGQALRDLAARLLSGGQGKANGGILGAFSLDQLAEMGERHLPQIKSLLRGMRAYQTERNKMLDVAGGRVAQWHSLPRKTAAALAELANESTLVEWDPSKAEHLLARFDATQARRRIRALKNIQTGAPNLFTATLADELADLQLRLDLFNRRAHSAAHVEAMWRRLVGPSSGATAHAVRGYAAAIERPGITNEERKRLYDALPEDAKAGALYMDIRDDYLEMGRRMEEALVARINAAALAGAVRSQAILQVRHEFERARQRGPYFPLHRHGAFYATAEKATGRIVGGRPEVKKAFLMYDTPRQRRRDLEGLKAAGWTITAQGVKAGIPAAMNAVNEGFIADATADLRKALGAYEGDKAAEILHQTFLATMPYLSHRVHFIHRKKTPGFSKDALRAYAFNMAHQANQVARMEQIPRFDAAIHDAEEHVKSVQDQSADGDATWSEAFLNEARDRFDWIMNPTGGKLAQDLNALGFVWYLGLAPASALVNLTQTAQFTLPELAAKYGWAAATAELSKSMLHALAMRGKWSKRMDYNAWFGLSPEELAAFRHWHDSGVIDNTQTYMLMGLAETDSLNYSPTTARALEITGALFQDAEVINRQASLLAAYRLARKGAGGVAAMSDAEARDFAADATWKTHHDYTNPNRARWMRGDAVKVLALFKTYAQRTTYYLGRSLQQMTAGESPEVRREARRKLFGVLGMSALLGGTTTGLPMVGLVMGTANLVMAALAAMDDSEDEPWDADAEWRSFLADFGLAGKIADRGIINTVTGADVANRIGMRSLWIREPDRDLNGKDTWHHYIEQILGPVIGIGASQAKAIDLLEGGHQDRAAEAAVPKEVASMLRAWRYADEGVLSTKGDVIVGPDQIGWYEIALQAIGFTPDEVRAQMDTNDLRKFYEGSKVDRRSALIGGLAMAILAEDADAIAEGRAAVARFNAGNSPNEKDISERDIFQSVATRKRYRKESMGGVYIRPQYREELEKVRVP